MPRKMRGIESKGMLLASHYTDADGNEKVELVGIPGAAPGTPVMLEGAAASTPPPQEPQAIDAELFFAVPFTVEDSHVCAAGKRLLVNGQPLVMEHVKSGTVQ